MIDIRIDGESADLLPTTSLTLERFNPLFDFDTIQGSRVYGFDLPDTPTNRRLLGYFFQDQVGYQTRRFRCEKYMHGQLIEQGFVMIHQVNPTFSLFFTQDLGRIFGDSQTLLLSQLNLGNDVIAPLASANHLIDRYCFPTIQNNAFYGNQAVDGFAGLVNQYDLATGYGPTARVPMPFVKWVFQQFGNLTGWTFTGQFWQDPDLCRLIFYNLFSLDGQSGAPAATINSNNHLPDLTLTNVLIDLRKLFNLYLEFDVRRNICTMDFGNDVINSVEILDWTDKADPKHLKAPDLINRLELSYDIDSNDALMKPVPPAMDIYTTPETAINEGGTTLPIKSRFSTLTTDPLTGRAMTQQAGISPNNKDSKNNTTPKFLFWHGVVNGQPLATADHGSRSLNWHGPNNLVDAGYRKFETFKGNAFTVTKLVSLSPADLALFSFRKKVHIKGINYVVASMKAALGNDRESIPTEVSLARI